MSIHKLKTIQPYFEKCWEQSKTFDVRINDRDFQAGDIVYLQEYNDVEKTYSGRELKCTITYVLSNYPNIRTGFVVFSFKVDEYIK